VKEKSIRLTHEMTNDETEEIAAITVIIGVHLDTNTRRARPLPADIRERAIRMCAEDGAGQPKRPDDEPRA
jgi:acyl-CoA thioester hydrolase